MQHFDADIGLISCGICTLLLQLAYVRHTVPRRSNWPSGRVANRRRRSYPLQRRVLASLDQIETILDRGVPIRRLAAALSKAGLLDGSGHPLSESHFRAAVSRARSRRRQMGTVIPPTTVSPGNPTVDQPKPSPPEVPTMAPTAAAEFFARQDTARTHAAKEAAKRPDFSAGLFPNLPTGKPKPKR